MNSKGITLIEILISLAISSVVILAVLGLTTLNIELAGQTNSRSDLGVDMMLVNDYFSRVVPSAGGELLPVWSSIFVEDDCEPRSVFPHCQKSDRLSVVKVRGLRVCNVTSSSGSTLRIQVSGGRCCLEDLDIRRSHFMLFRSNAAGQRFAGDIDMGSCSMRASAGPLAFADTVPQPSNWAGAVLIPIDIQTFYLDKTNGNTELVRYSYLNPGSNPEDGVAAPIVDRVMDFQIGLGFDFNPGDGIIQDLGNDVDEVLYNAVGEGWGTGAFSSSPLTTLRNISLGLIMGHPLSNSQAPSSRRVLNGDVLSQTGWAVDHQVSRFTIRSTRNFQ